MVCNNFRNDLIHPNEYIAGRALRLVASIQNRFILESLIESIVSKCLNHNDMYVRRYAVVCLVKIFEYYGDAFIPDIADKLLLQLEKESDLTTKRNIFILFFKLDKEKATSFLLDKIKEEDHEYFGDILQLIIVKLVQEAMLKDRKTTGTAFKIITEFSASKFASVLYEVASSLIRYNRTPAAMRNAVSILLQILKNNNDNNVKLLVLDQLEIIRQRDKLAIMDSFIDIATMVLSGDSEIKDKFMPFIETYIRKENIGVLQKSLIQEFKDCLASHSTGNEEYQTKIVLLFDRLVTQGIIGSKTYFKEVLPILLHNHDFLQSTFDIVRISFQNIFQHLDASEKQGFLEVLRNNLQEIRDIKMCALAINTVGQHVTSAREAQEVLGVLLESVGEIPLKKKQAVVEKKAEEPVQEKKYIRKTVVKDDGTYGEVMIEATDETQLKESGEAPTYKIREFVISSEDFCLTLSRAFARLLATLEADSAEVKIGLGTVVMLICEFIKFHLANNVRSADRRKSSTKASSSSCRSSCGSWPIKSSSKTTGSSSQRFSKHRCLKSPTS